MIFETQDRWPSDWRRVFAWFPVPLFDEEIFGRRAWLQTVERRFPKWPGMRFGNIAIYRPLGSDWDIDDGAEADRTTSASGDIFHL